MNACEARNRTSYLVLMHGEQSCVDVTGDGAVILHPDVFASSADDWFSQLHAEVDWQNRTVRVFGREHLEPRLGCWYGEVPYTYSGLTWPARPMSDLLTRIADACRPFVSDVLNSVLATLYRDGEDKNGWHRDDESIFGPTPTICSISLGAARRFDLRRERDGHKIGVTLPHGSLLIMTGNSQRDWKHQIARTKKVNDPRINLTFRTVQYRQS